MNELRNLLAANEDVLASAATEYGSSLGELAEGLRLSELLGQFQSSGAAGGILLAGGLPAYPPDRWFEEQRGVAASDAPLDGWVEFLQAPGAEFGLLVPNDPSPQSRLAVFASDEAIAGPVWATFTRLEGRPVLTSIGADIWHCMMTVGGCTPMACGGPCEPVEAVGIPGSRRCLCADHRK